MPFSKARWRTQSQFTAMLAEAAGWSLRRAHKYIDDMRSAGTFPGRLGYVDDRPRARALYPDGSFKFADMDYDPIWDTREEPESRRVMFEYAGCVRACEALRKTTPGEVAPQREPARPGPKPGGESPLKALAVPIAKDILKASDRPPHKHSWRAELARRVQQALKARKLNYELSSITRVLRANKDELLHPDPRIRPSRTRRN